MVDVNNMWVFKYEPKSLDEMVVTDEKKKILQNVIENVPNTLLAGNYGTGKGTFMNILLRETNYEHIKINASLENSVDDVRSKILRFATSLGLTKYKIVYLNEADRLSLAAQEGLKQTIEDVHKFTRFFFVCNNPSRIDKGNLSRVMELDLNDPPPDQLFLKCIEILKKERIKVKNKQAIADIIKKCYPDIRKIINTLQFSCMNGVLDKPKFGGNSEVFATILESMKKGAAGIPSLRETLKSYPVDYDEVWNFLYKMVMDDDTDWIKSPMKFIALLGEYYHKHHVVAIKEINFMAFFIDLVGRKII